MVFSRCFGRLSRIVLANIRTPSTVLPRGYKMSTAARKSFERLPSTVIPVNYDLKLTPNLKEFSFEGIVNIDVDVRSPTKSVVLNAAELDIQKCTFSKEEQGGSRDGKVTLKDKEETATFDFDVELPVGKGKLEIKYTGTLNDKMKGFYRTRYTTPWGEERFAAATQFEPTDARRALPCWDEPELKATFDVTLVVPHDRLAISNMNAIKDERIASDLRRVTFARTPKMSTYLLAFVVGEFDYVEDRDSNGVLIRVYTPLNKSDQGKFALEVAKKTLPFYHKYFNVEYPLPKLDLITIPDFAAGAMENWGLVTYRERYLLVDPSNTSIASRQLVALVVGHELAHQWFGNLVTMKWWTHLWLNEGFATFVEYLCVDHCLGSEYDIWTQFNSQTYSPALKNDSLANSHPIEVEVGHPSEVEEIFDMISYSKGASIIRMLYDWIGDENFRKGMNHYLTKFQYGNAETGDLWVSLGNASGQPVAEVMGTWTEKMGYPVLSVTRKQDGGDTVLTVSQKKFCAGGKETEDFTKYLWKVPVNVQTPHGVEKFLLNEREEEFRLKGVSDKDWIKVNPEQKGFFRVKYSEEMLTRLKEIVKTLPASDRLGLLDEAFALASAGVVSTKDALMLCEGYKEEENYTVWENLSGHLSEVSRLLSNTDFHSQYKAFCEKLFSTIAARLTWEGKEGEAPLDGMLRGLVLANYGRYGNKETIQEAQKRFSGDITAVPVDLRSAVYQISMWNGDRSTFDKLLKLSEETDHQEEKVRIYSSLGCTEDKALIDECFQLGIGSKGGIRSADSWPIFVYLARSSSAGREKMWEFIKGNLPKLKERFGGMFLLPRVLEMTVCHFACDDRAKEIEDFFNKEDNKIDSADRAIKQSCETIRNNASWLKRDQESLKEFLKGQ